MGNNKTLIHLKNLLAKINNLFVLYSATSLLERANKKIDNKIIMLSKTDHIVIKDFIISLINLNQNKKIF